MDLFSSLKSFFKANPMTIDNVIFQLHYKATFVILVAFSILVTARQYVGDPIDCMSDKSVPANLLDTYCWIHPTFSLPDAWKKEVGKDVPYPGIDTFANDEKRVYHAYYQWVCFVLFFQAILFYIPRYFWKVAEGGRLKELVMNLNVLCLDEESKKKSKAMLANYLLSHVDSHRMYVLAYLLAEILNFANVVGQVFLMDAFLGGEFTRYGLKVVQFTEWDGALRHDPMVQVFPRLTKCTFHLFGDAGSVERRDALCLLPVNVINEKIYVFLWLWFVCLAFLSAAVLAYRMVLLHCPRWRSVVLRLRSSCADKGHLKAVVDNGGLGDWFVLYLLSKNLDAVNFRDVIASVAEKLDEGRLRTGFVISDYDSHTDLSNDRC